MLTDRGLVREIIDAVVEQAGLDKKPRGKMQIDLLGEPHTIVVEEYERFGESSFRLTLGEQGGGETKQAKG